MAELSIIDGIRDRELFRGFLGDDLTTWKPWLTALRVVYGLRIKSEISRALVRQCTGRDPEHLPSEGFQTALFLTGRRSGKSRTAAIVGAFEAALAGHEKKLARGERGVVAVCAPTKQQARIVHGYLTGIFQTGLLRGEVVRETGGSLELRNGIVVQVLAGDFRTIRGFTLVAAVVDEAAFFGVDEESKIRSDTELIRAIRPGLASLGGKLVVISSPYARKGWCWQTHRKHFGNDAGTTLVWNCPSRTMNPTLPQRVVDEAMAEDLAAAKSEFLGEFRDDVAVFLPREVIEAQVVRGRKELPWMQWFGSQASRYFAFCDVSGGRNDDAALAVGHKTEEGKVAVDLLRRWRPPFSPQQVIGAMAETLRSYHLGSVTGDNYSAEFVASAFASCGINYRKCDVPKSALYLELLPRLCSGQVELLDDPVTIAQLANLERRTRTGGKDLIDHPPGAHDDLGNVVAGVVRLGNRGIRVGAPLQRDSKAHIN